MASPPAASVLLCLVFLSSLISPISSRFPSIHPHIPSIHPRIPSVHPRVPGIHPRIPSIHPRVPGISSPCSILGDLLPDLSDPCDAVAVPLAPCVGAMMFRSGKSNKVLTEACCEGAAIVAKGRGTSVGKLAVCGCLKDVFSQISIITPQNLRDVLAKCSNVSLPVPNSNSSCIS